MRLQTELDEADALSATAARDAAGLARLRAIDPNYNPWAPIPSPSEMQARAHAAIPSSAPPPNLDDDTAPPPDPIPALRDAKTAYDTALAEQRRAQEVVDRAGARCESADADLASYRDLDERIIAASIASLKAGEADGHLPYALAAEQRQRGAAIDHLDAARKALDRLGAELRQAEQHANTAKATLARAAVNVVMRRADGVADRLELAEREALAVREQLLSLSMTWFSHFGGPAPCSARMVKLVSEPPPGANAVHKPALVAQWRAMHEALLADPDADAGDFLDAPAE